MKIRVISKSIDLENSGFFSILAYLFLFFNLYRMISRRDAAYLVIMVLIGSVGFLKVLTDKYVHGKWVALCVSLLFSICSAINHFVTNNIAITNVLQGVALFGIGYLFVLYKPSKRLAFISYSIVAVIFSIYWVSGTHPSRVLTSSCNYISVILILFVTIYYSSVEYNEITIMRLIPAISCFFLCVWGRGRGGIFSSGILVAGLLLVKMIGLSTKKKIAVGLLASSILIVSALVTINTDIIGRFSWIFGSFTTEGFTDTARGALWTEYIQVTFSSMKNLVFGTALSDLYLIPLYNSNPHNSFIYLHMTAGIVPIIILFILLLKSIRYYLRNKKYTTLLCLVVFCLRAFTDKFVFLQYGTPVFVYLAFMPCMYKVKSIYPEAELSFFPVSLGGQTVRRI